MTVTYAPVLFPLLDTLRVGRRTEIWLIFVFLRALSMVSLHNQYCIVARRMTCLSSCGGEQSEGDCQVEASQNLHCVAGA